MESAIEESKEVTVTNPGGGNVVIVESLGASEDGINWTLRWNRTETGTETDGNGGRERDRQPEHERWYPDLATERTLFAVTPQP